MPQVRCLRDQCIMAFSNYAREARKTSGLLGDLKDDPASLERLFAVLEQKQVEDGAREAYLLLRQQLFELETFVDQAEAEPVRF
jgi:hypothetical protein